MAMDAVLMKNSQTQTKMLELELMMSRLNADAQDLDVGAVAVPPQGSLPTPPEVGKDVPPPDAQDLDDRPSPTGPTRVPPQDPPLFARQQRVVPPHLRPFNGPATYEEVSRADFGHYYALQDAARARTSEDDERESLSSGRPPRHRYYRKSSQWNDTDVEIVFRHYQRSCEPPDSVAWVSCACGIFVYPVSACSQGLPAWLFTEGFLLSAR